MVVAMLVTTSLPPTAARARAQHTRTGEEHAAHDAQRRFESFRRFHMPRVASREGRCDVSIGRLCYWDDNDDAPFPAERDRITDARERLRHTLDSLGASDSASDFIIGQRVRYALESVSDSSATDILAHCTATPWWCNALRGLAWHHFGQEARSAAAYDSALAAMPDTLRCDWMDSRPWLPGGVHLPSADEDSCAARARLDARLFWLAAPLLSWRPQATRDEYLARHTMAAIVAGTATPEGLSWGSDIEEVALRYGWPSRWAREEDRPVTLTTPDVRVIGHEPRPSFSFVPNRHALDSALAASPADWQLQGDPRPPMRYAPGWLLRIDTLPIQISRFRRANGDSMIVVTAFDARNSFYEPPNDTLTAISGGPPAPLMAAVLLAVNPDSTIAITRATTPLGGGIMVLTGPARPSLMAVEVVDSTNARAARWRGAMAPLTPGALVSDLLIGVADSAPAVPTLAGAARHAVARLLVPAGDTMAVYWESYARVDAGHPARVTLRLVPLEHGLLRGIARTLGLAHAQSPIALAWDDPGRADSTHGRALRIAIPDIPPGRYRIELAVRAGAVQSVAQRDIVVTPALRTATPN